MYNKGGVGIAVVVVVIVFAGIVTQQEGTMAKEDVRLNYSCLNQLAPCLNYLNGTRHPPDNCCDPLKAVIKSNPECLCSMISNQGTQQAEQAGINVNEAQQLPARCGQRVNPLSCLSPSSPSNSKNSIPNSANSYSLLSPGGGSMPAATALSLSVQIILLVGIKYNLF